MEPMSLSLNSDPSLRPLLLAAALCIIAGCPGDDDQSSEAATAAATAGTATAATDSATSTATSSSVDTTAGTTAAGSTSGAADCDDATDQAACATAQNLAEGGPCTWMPIFELTIAADVCSFSPTDRGACVGTLGLDDGCNEGSLCDSGDVQAYYDELEPGVWEMAQGRACRGITGFMQCNDTLEAPCTCACEIPSS